MLLLRSVLLAFVELYAIVQLYLGRVCVSYVFIIKKKLRLLR
jgi:hypothetical protein